MNRLCDVLGRVTAGCVWGLIALVPVLLFLGLVVAVAVALWWAGFG